MAVLLCGYLAVASVGCSLAPLQYRLSHNELWNLPARWDAGWYLGIARRGYDWKPELEGRQQSIAFFPAFPLLMRAAGEAVTVPARALASPELFGNGNTRVTWGGVLVACLAFVVGLVQFLRLGTLLTGDPNAALRAATLLAAWPFALFFSAPYSEALFFLGSVSAMLAYTRGRHLRAFGWGLLAGLSRSNGWALSLGLLVMALSGAGGGTVRAVTAALGPAIGTAIYSGYVWQLTGDPLAWVRAQEGWGREFSAVGFIAHRVDRVRAAGVAGYFNGDPTDIVAVTAVVVAVIGTTIAGFRVHWGLAVFPIVYLLPAMLIDLPAIGRMTSVLFPAFLGLALVLSRSQANGTAVVMGLLQGWLAVRFFTWQTPF